MISNEQALTCEDDPYRFVDQGSKTAFGSALVPRPAARDCRTDTLLVHTPTDMASLEADAQKQSIKSERPAGKHKDNPSITNGRLEIA
jgi:hypothetical protein